MRSAGLACLIASAATAAPTAYTWVGANGNAQWTVAGNWSPVGVPGLQAGDSAELDGGVVVLTGALPQKLAGLQLYGGAQLTLIGAAWKLDVDALTVGANGTLRIDDDETDAGIALVARAFTVAPLGVVDATGTGFPGGPSGSPARGLGPGGGDGNPDSTYGGAGASHGGFGASDSIAVRSGPPYGDAKHPSLPGSGGGGTVRPGHAGGFGGGRVRVIASERITLEGVVRADGAAGTPIGSSYGGAGAGGSVWLSAPIITGNGSISANGAFGASGRSGAGGRIALDGPSSAPPALVLSARPPPGFSLTDTFQTGGAGTIAFVEPGGAVHLTIDPQSTGLNGVTELPELELASLTLGPGAQVAVPRDELSMRDRFSMPGGFATMLAYSMSTGGGGRLTVHAGEIDIAGQLNLAGFGFASIGQPGGGPGGGTGYPVDSGMGVGASHGGRGGGSLTSAPLYGSLTAPFTLGSAGSASLTTLGTTGGGALRLFARGACTLNGRLDVSARDTMFDVGGGAGGSVSIAAATFAGTGFIKVTGGLYGGGGGRVAIFAGTQTFTGTVAANGAFHPFANGGDGVVVMPGSSSRIVLVSPAHDARAIADLQFSWPLPELAAELRVYVDDDEQLGEGSDGPFDLDPGEPMRTLPTSTQSVSVSGLTLGRAYWWHVAAFTADGGVLAGSEVRRFIACEGASCAMPIDAGPPDAGLPDAGQPPADGGTFDAPFFTTTPEPYGRCAVPYRYSPSVGGSGPFTFSLRAASDHPLPGGLGVEASTGEVRWTPTADDVGGQYFDLVASGPGGETTQPVVVGVFCHDPAVARVCGCSSSAGAWVFGLALLVRARRGKGRR